MNISALCISSAPLLAQFRRSVPRSGQGLLHDAGKISLFKNPERSGGGASR
jgi:hypothetical protein